MFPWLFPELVTVSPRKHSSFAFAPAPFLTDTQKRPRPQGIDSQLSETLIGGGGGGGKGEGIHLPFLWQRMSKQTQTLKKKFFTRK